MKSNYLIIVFCFALFITLTGCQATQDFQLAERYEGFKPARESLHSIVILAPDYYLASGSDFDLRKNEKTIELEKTVLARSIIAGNSLGLYIVVPGADDIADAPFFNDIERLRKEMTNGGYVYNIQSMDVKINFPNAEPLTENLILSLDLHQLQEKYHTPYFFHTTVLQHDKDLYFLSVLSDLSLCKIVYRKLVKVKMNPNNATIGLIMFNNFQNMLDQK